MKIIHDIRGDAYKCNQIEITDKGYIRYAGMPVEYIKRSKNPLFPSPSIYTLFGLRGLELADIALNKADVQLIEELTAL
jgi:hypothetical protein